MRIETAAVHAGRAVDQTTGAVAAPIILSTTFERDADGGHTRGFTYARTNNPNRAELETAMAELEGGAGALAFSSGLAAAAAVFHALRPGEHVVAPREIYHGVRTLLEQVFRPWGLKSTFVSMHNPGAAAGAITENTRLVWTETPANPMLQITDLRAVAGAAHEAGALLACDNTFATPVLQRPIEHGADLVVHATTKWIGGHSDHTGGVLVYTREDEVAKRLRLIQNLAGAVPGPVDCWLATRGLRTLATRVRTSSVSAQRIAECMTQHKRVERVLYPGLATHEGHGVACRQMSGFGGLLSLCVRGGREEAMAVAARVRLLTRATSLGGVESLIEHRESIEGPHTTTPANLLRLSIGQEHADDLIADLEQALEG